MRIIVIGLGVQGTKRRRVAGTDFVAGVDPAKSEAEYRRVEDVPLAAYDAALCCIPDASKYDVSKYCLSNGKHVLVEKPLSMPRHEQLLEIGALARDKGLVCYTAYNHRFEPHVSRMKALIDSGELGRLYSCRLFYGNGTARQVRDSLWRDQGAGVLPDLGSHLLDCCRFWFGEVGGDFEVRGAHRFENRAPDHVVVSNERSEPRIELEMSLLSWRNGFTCDILAERGSAHIDSLCKWGPSMFTRRARIIPSGRPSEESVTLVRDDQTWALEYAHFNARCAGGAGGDDLDGALWIDSILRKLSHEATRRG
jgi:predicted dehydrogenase